MTETTKNKERPLTGKQKAFIDAYLSNGYNASRAAETAGYKGNENYLGVCGNRLINNDKIKSEIANKTAQTSKKCGITIATIQSELEELRQLALYKGDYSTAARCLELKGKTVGAYTDNINSTDLTKQAELTEQEQIEARRIANIRLADFG